MADQQAAVILTQGGGVIHSGRPAVDIYQLKVIRQGLRACKIGGRLNRAYTPKNLMAMVHKLCGVKHGARDYDGAIATLTAKIAEAEAVVPLVDQRT